MTAEEFREHWRSESAPPLPRNSGLRVPVTRDDLQEFRATYGLSVTLMASVLGMYRRSYQRWERGTSSPPPYFWLVLERLAQIIEGESIP